MGKCVIFCAGGFDSLAEPIAEDDFVIAADGGWAHVRRLGLGADMVLGDFDSLGFVPAGAEIFPVEKDDTDAMLAVRLGLSRGFREFLLYGSLDGPRLDHTVANFQTLQFLTDQGARGYLAGLKTMATVVSGETVYFPAGAEGTVSVFCLGSDARGVSLTGLYYPLDRGTLKAGFPLGVSNHFTGIDAAIRVEEGSVLVLYDRENGFPSHREPLGGTSWKN